MLNSISFLISLLFGCLFFFQGCDLFENDQPINTDGTISGSWKLEKIYYETGEILTPSKDEVYWLTLSSDSVFAEGKNHLSLLGQSNCNSCFGWYDVDEENQEIDLSFICDRTICGISTEFSVAISTSFCYSFNNNDLILNFEYSTTEITTIKGFLLLNRIN